MFASMATQVQLFICILMSGNLAISQDAATVASKKDTISILSGLIANDKLLSSGYTGLRASPSKPFARSIYLIALANDQELFSMTKDSSRYLRIYAYIGILHRSPEKEKKARRRLLRDKTIIETRSGCYGEDLTIAKAVKNMHLWYEKESYDKLLENFRITGKVNGFTITDLLN